MKKQYDDITCKETRIFGSQFGEIFVPEEPELDEDEEYDRMLSEEFASVFPWKPGDALSSG